MTLDEEWARTLFAFIGSRHHPTAARLLTDEIRRSFERRPKLQAAFEQKGVRVSVADKGGSFDATVVELDLNATDRGRINRVVRKMVKGLSYTHSEVTWPDPCPLPKDTHIAIHRVSPMAFERINYAFDSTPRHGDWTRMGDEGAIRFRAVSEARSSHNVAWMLLFYNCIAYLAYAGPRSETALGFIERMNVQ
jgi:ribosomal protein S10